MSLKAKQKIAEWFIISVPLSFCLYWIMYWPNSDLVGPHQNYVFEDFMKIWIGGRLALDGRVDEIYDLLAFYKVVNTWFPAHNIIANMSYPPTMLVLIAPLSIFPFWLSAPIWVLGGLIAYWFAVVQRRTDPFDVKLFAMLALCPAMVVNIGLGQNGGYTALLFLIGFMSVRDRPIVAGICFGLLTVKPQLGLLIPFALILMGAWRTIFTAAVVALGLAVVSWLAYGSTPWADFSTYTVGMQAYYLANPGGGVAWLGSAPYIYAWFLGLPSQWCYVFQAMVALPVAGAALWYFAGAADYRLRVSILAVASVIITPYSMAYDLAIPIAAVLAYLLYTSDTVEPRHLVAMRLFFYLPAVMILSQRVGAPVAFPVLAYVFWVLCAMAQRHPLSELQAKLASHVKLPVLRQLDQS